MAGSPLLRSAIMVQFRLSNAEAEERVGRESAALCSGDETGFVVNC